MRDELKLLMLVDELDGSTGGTEQHISFLLKYLPERFKIILVLLRDTGFWDEDAFPVKPTFIGFKSFYSPFQVIRAVSRIKSMLLRSRIQVVHTFFPESQELALPATYFTRTVPVISSRRNMGYWKSKGAKFRTRIASPLITHLIANSVAVKNATILKEGVSADKIEVIYNPIIDERFICKDETYNRGSFGVKSNELVVGIVANLRPIKDHFTFLYSARLVQERFANVKFILVGGGRPEYIKSLRDLAENLGILAKVIFAGEIRNPTKILSLFDIGVLTSRSEGLSNALVEYGYAGLPTVATDVGGNKEVIVHGKTGYLVPHSNAEALAERVVEFLNDADKRKQFGKTANVFIRKKFDKYEILKSYENCYYEVIKQFDKRKERRDGI